MSTEQLLPAEVGEVSHSNEARADRRCPACVLRLALHPSIVPSGRLARNAQWIGCYINGAYWFSSCTRMARGNS
jgi:hypothetical protein